MDVSLRAVRSAAGRVRIGAVCVLRPDLAVAAAVDHHLILRIYERLECMEKEAEREWAERRRCGEGS